ncbi:MAG: hypothetical protein KC422_05755 [Trueperaceae bacterium]|nr:hypothetical protein [Trueperaceae bacterium]
MVLEGHSSAKSLLRQISAHTLLFTGPEKVGRRQAARWFCALLNCQTPGEEPCGQCQSCRLIAQDEHPDYREVHPDLMTTTGRLNRRPEIRISQLVPRQGSSEFALATWLESRPTFKTKLGVIDGAHLLNLSAANAFLKTLEEPPSWAKIILIAPSGQAILPTLTSRCTIVSFAPDRQLVNRDTPLARLGRFGESKTNTETELGDLIESYLKGLKGNLEEAFEAADALEKGWETSSDASELLLARLSAEVPSSYYMANAALEEFEKALSSYSSSHLAMLVLTLELRSCLKVA